MFKDVLNYFDDKDVFIFNDTKVFPARLYGNKEKTGCLLYTSDNSRNLLTRYYLGGNYELDVDSTGMHERLYLGGGYYDCLLYTSI